MVTSDRVCITKRRPVTILVQVHRIIVRFRALRRLLMQHLSFGPTTIPCTPSTSTPRHICAAECVGHAGLPGHGLWRADMFRHGHPHALATAERSHHNVACVASRCGHACCNALCSCGRDSSSSKSGGYTIGLRCMGVQVHGTIHHQKTPVPHARSLRKPSGPVCCVGCVSWSLLVERCRAITLDHVQGAHAASSHSCSRPGLT